MAEAARETPGWREDAPAEAKEGDEEEEEEEEKEAPCVEDDAGSGAITGEEGSKGDVNKGLYTCERGAGSLNTYTVPMLLPLLVLLCAEPEALAIDVDVDADDNGDDDDDDDDEGVAGTWIDASNAPVVNVHVGADVDGDVDAE